jgi:hypothetical protein
VWSDGQALLEVGFAAEFEVGSIRRPPIRPSDPTCHTSAQGMDCGRRGALGAFAILTLGALKPGCGFQLTGPALSCGLARPQAPRTTGVATSLESSRWGCRVVRRAEEQDGAAAADPQVGPQPAPKGFAKGAGASDDVSPTGVSVGCA